MADPQKLIGVEIDQFLILQHIARGGMADLYLARDVKLDRPVALKLVLPALAQMQEFTARFQREARATARINHPNVVQIYTNGLGPGGRPYIALEYIAGGSLADRLATLHQTNERMAVIEALAVSRDAALGLQVAHDAGIIHRDLKPSNILLRPDGAAVLSDLGIAAVQFEATRLTQTGTMQGTPHYMAPEQAKADAPVDGRADIYALGVILHELLAGSPPFNAQSPWGIIHQHISEAPPPLDRLRTGLTPETYGVVSTCLKKVPSRRYQTAGELAAALESAAKAEQSGSLSRPTIAIPRWLRFATLGGALFLAVFLLWTLLSDSPTVDSDSETIASAILPTITSLPTVIVETIVATSTSNSSVGGDDPSDETPPAKPTSTREPEAMPTDEPTHIPAPITERHFPSGLIAYACDSRNGYQIWMSEPDTGEQILLANQPANSLVPAFAPDGRQIAYRSNASGTWQIYASDLDGANQRMIADDAAYDNFEAVWSPSGDHFAFVSDRTGSKQIYSMSVFGSTPERLTFNNSENDDPTWSVNDDIAFESNVGGRYSIYVVDPGGGAAVELLVLGGSSSTPAWSPDGQRLAFEVTTSQTRQIWTTDRFGNNPQQITSQGTINERPAWSPDSRWLAFHSNYQQSSDGAFDIWTVDTETKRLRRITIEGDCYNPAWSPAAIIPER